MSTNSTHRKRLARAYASQSGLTYTQALDRVRQAADRGVLPHTLDDDGMDQALTALAALPFTAARPTAWTGEVRVATDPRDQIIFDLSAAYEQHTGKQGLLYIYSPENTPADLRYKFGSTTALGRREAVRLMEDLHRGANLPPDPFLTGGAVIGGPFRSQVYNGTGTQRGMPRCDACNRKIAPQGLWWMVYLPGVGWADDRGCVCVLHNAHALSPWQGTEDDAPPPVDPADRTTDKTPEPPSQASSAAVSSPPTPSVGLTTPNRNGVTLVRGLLVQTPDREVLKISEFYDATLTAQVLYPIPPRTTVRHYTYAEADNFQEPSAAMLKRYEDAWGFTT